MLPRCFHIAVRLIAPILMVASVLAPTAGFAQSPEQCLVPDFDDKCETWVARFDHPNSIGGQFEIEVGTKLAVSPSGDRAYIVGPVNRSVDIAVVAFDTDTGETLWTSSYNGPKNWHDEPFGVAVSPDGETIFVTGRQDINPPYSSDLVVFALDAASGQEMWSSSFDAQANVDSNNAGLAVAVAPDSSVVFVTGAATIVSPNYYSNYNMVTAAYDAVTGARLWIEEYDSPFGRVDAGTAIAISPDGTQVFVSGHSTASKAIDYVTVTHDATTGQRLWMQRHSSEHADGVDIAKDIGVSPDGRLVYVTGREAIDAYTSVFSTVAYDTRCGTVEWSQTFGGSDKGYSDAGSLAVSPTGEQVAVAGKIPGRGNRDSDIGTAVYDARTGAPQWDARVSTPILHKLGRANEGAKSVTFSSNGRRLYVAGTDFVGDSNDAVTAGYDAADGRRTWIARYQPTPRSVGAGIAVDVGTDPRTGRVLMSGLHQVWLVDRDRPERTPWGTSYDFALAAYDDPDGAGTVAPVAPEPPSGTEEPCPSPSPEPTPTATATPTPTPTATAAPTPTPTPEDEELHSTYYFHSAGHRVNHMDRLLSGGSTFDTKPPEGSDTAVGAETYWIYNTAKSGRGDPTWHGSVDQTIKSLTVDLYQTSPGDSVASGEVTYQVSLWLGDNVFHLPRFKDEHPAAGEVNHVVHEFMTMLNDKGEEVPLRIDPRGEDLTISIANWSVGGTVDAMLYDSEEFPSGFSVSNVSSLPDPDPTPTPTPTPTETQPLPTGRGHYPESPDDPFFKAPSGATSLEKGVQWGPQTIKAPQAWQVKDATGWGTKVAVVDTGVDAGHEDLACPGKIEVIADSDLVADDGDPRDEHAHGTHVAGIIGACTDNGTGMAGVAPDATIMPIRVLDASGSGWSDDLSKGIRNAAEGGAHVINMSLGFGPDSGSGLWDFNQIDQAIGYATRLGAVVVAAAGNSSFPICEYPAVAKDVICVGATDRRDVKAWYSGFANKSGQAAVVAPGGSAPVFCDVHSENILSLVPTRLDRCNERMAGYGGMNGTSMAAPHVAGVAALVYDRLGGERSSQNAQRVIDALTSTAVDLGPPGFDRLYGSGRVDALGAVLAIEIPDLSFTEDSATSGQHSDQAHMAARLLTPEGTAMAGAEVSFTLKGESGTRDFAATTDESGRAATDIVIEEPAGSYALTARYAGDERYAGTRAATDFTVSADDSATALVVSGYGSERTLTATVTDQDTPDSGVAGVAVTFNSDGEAIGQGVTDEAGVATLHPPAPHDKGAHSYEAAFAGNGFYLPSTDEALTGEGVSSLGFTAASAVTGQYSDDADIEAQLQDEGGDPIEGAVVAFELSGPGGSRSYTAATDTAGIARATTTLELVPGTYTLSARYDGLLGEHTSAAASSDFEITKEDTTLVLEVAGNGSKRRLIATLRDHDAATDGIGTREISFYSDGELLGSATTNADGAASFDPPGRYQGGRRTYRAVFDGDEFYVGSADEEST